MEFNPQSYTPDGVAVFGRDDQSMVKFYRHPELSKYKSDEAGRPVYEDIEMVSVIQPGEKEETKVLASEWHRRRFPRQYEAFKKGLEQNMSGTPLDHLFPSEPSTIMTLKSFNVFTVEQLANLTDTAKGNLPMAQQLVDRAQNYLKTAAGGAPFHQMEAMQKQISDLQAQLAEKQSNNPTAEPPRRGPGRPSKETS